MTTKVTFYILNDPLPKGRALYTCRVIEKAYSSNHKIYVYAANLEEAQSFDTQLWTFGDISFVPHEIYDQNSNQGSPVVIGYADITVPTDQNDVLVNLTVDIPPFHPQFKRIIEVIPNDDVLKKLARKRFQGYQKQGLQVETFNVV